MRNLIITAAVLLSVWARGLISALSLGYVAFRSWRGGNPVAAVVGTPEGLRQAFDVVRAFVPNLSFSGSFVKAYANTGTVGVMRRVDVLDVLNRDADFEVVYEPRMRKLTGGENFFLGMQPGWAYTRDTSAMRLAARRSDVAELVLPPAAARAEEIVAESDGCLDLPQTLTHRIPWETTRSYFGVGGPDQARMQAWTTVLFHYLFGDLKADPTVEAEALEAAAALRNYLDEAIAARKSNPTEAPDILNRCLALQGSETPGMSDLGIRNNLLGLLIGAIPTISKASCLALDELFRHPDGFHSASRAACDGDDAILAACIWEALRFNPHNPVIYRRATRDTLIAASTLRQTRVRKGQIVFAASLSAMFDARDIPAPHEFRTDRPFGDYILWGTGMHTCFGAAINEAVIPAILKPLLRQRNLRRAEGAAGQIDTGGTAFPQHFTVAFDPARLQ